MAKVNWTFQALEDLDEIAEYRAKYSEKYASFLIDAIFEQTQSLEAFPYSGRVVPELKLPSIRELILKLAATNKAGSSPQSPPRSEQRQLFYDCGIFSSGKPVIHLLVESDWRIFIENDFSWLLV